MAPSRLRQIVSLTLAVAGGAAVPASAQTDQTANAPDRRVAIGLEAAAVASRTDNIAFFNYTDYKHNALRVGRLRLMAEWRATEALSFVGEARAENGNSLDVPALYLRWRPWTTGRVAIQAGRVPPLVGAFSRRAYGRANVVIGSPLAYQYLVSLRPDALPATVDDLLRMRGRGWQPSFPVGSQALRPGLPLVSASRWDTGVQISGQVRGLTLAGALTEGPPAYPSIRDRSPGFGWSGRASLTLPAGVVIGASGGTGNWIDRAVSTTPAPQRVIGIEAETGRGPWLIRTEWFYSTFRLPIPPPAPPLRLATHVGFVEGRYRITARWQFGARLERLRFAPIAGSLSRGPTPWDADVDRAEAALSYRAATSFEIKAGWQYNWRDGGRVRALGYPAIQLLYWY